MNHVYLSQLDEDIRGHKAKLQLGEALDRLLHNRDFKEVILEGYLREEAIRLVHLKAHQDHQSPEKQAAIASKLDAVGHFHQFISRVQSETATAVKDLHDAEQAREDFLSEERS